MKRPLILCAFALCAAAASAQADGGISPQMLQQIRKAVPTTTADRALYNAISANNIDNLAKNAAAAGEINTEFSDETPEQSITNQKSSGRCWMFSGLNVLRANFAKAHKDTLAVEFSQDYLFFYDQLEKSNLMLQACVDNAKKPMDDIIVQYFFRSPIGDGGTFCGVADLAAKYGLAPKGAQPETYNAENTSKLGKLLASKLREYGLELRRMALDGKGAAAIKTRKTQMLATIYRMLSLTLGEPVKEFNYAFRDKKGKTRTETKTYTPLEFYKETVGDALNGTFIMVMNDPRRPYHKTYEVEYNRHAYDGHNWKYLNLPMEEIEALAIAAIKDGRKMYSSYDVGKQLDRQRGYLDTENYDYGALFATTFPMTKADRIATFDSGSTHAMTLCAVDLDANGKPVKWKVENSWGATSGHKGCMIMTARWFREYMFRLVVDKKYASATLLHEFDQQPVMVMPDDPLFDIDR